MVALGVVVSNGIDYERPIDETIVNRAPELRITLDKTFSLGTTLNIYGRDSFDPDGDTFTIATSTLSQPAGSDVHLVAVDPTHWTLDATHEGAHTFRFTATDSKGATAYVDRTFTAESIVSPPPNVVGDWDTEGAEVPEENVLCILNPGRTDGQVTQPYKQPTVNLPGTYERWGVIEDTDLSVRILPKALYVPTKSWKFEFVARNAGTGELKGHELRCAPDGLEWPVDAQGREYGYLRYCVMWPDNFMCQGDMKMWDISGWEIWSEVYGKSTSTSNPSRSFSAGLMSGLTGTRALVKDGGGLQLTHYVKGDSGPWNFDTHNYSPPRPYYERVRTNPGYGPNGELPTRQMYESQPRLTITPWLGTDKWVEFLHFVAGNSAAGKRDGEYKLWVQPAGQPRVLRTHFHNMLWVEAAPARGLITKWRSFWGGGSDDRPRYPTFAGPATGDDEAPHYRDGLICRSMPQMPRTS